MIPLVQNEKPFMNIWTEWGQRTTDPPYESFLYKGAAKMDVWTVKGPVWSFESVQPHTTSKTS